jgi:hypothetical protein
VDVVRLVGVAALVVETADVAEGFGVAGCADVAEPTDAGCMEILKEAGNSSFAAVDAPGC